MTASLLLVQSAQVTCHTRPVKPGSIFAWLCSVLTTSFWLMYICRQRSMRFCTSWMSEVDTLRLSAGTAPSAAGLPSGNAVDTGGVAAAEVAPAPDMDRPPPRSTSANAVH